MGITTGSVAREITGEASEAADVVSEEVKATVDSKSIPRIILSDAEQDDFGRKVPAVKVEFLNPLFDDYTPDGSDQEEQMQSDLVTITVTDQSQQPGETPSLVGELFAPERTADTVVVSAAVVTTAPDSHVESVAGEDTFQEEEREKE